MTEPFRNTVASSLGAGSNDGALTADRASCLVVSLMGEKHALDEFTRAMEGEFLALGSALGNISGLARQVRDRADEVIGAASGRTEDAAIQFAFQLLKKAEDLVHASSEQYANVLAVFDNIQDGLANLARQRNALEQILFPLGMIKIQFRIQSCSFDGAARNEFFGLSSSIADLVKDVRSAVGEKFEQLAHTQRATGEFAAKLATTMERQRHATGRTLAEVRSHLSSLNDVLRSSEQVALSLSQAGDGIASGVGKAIVALQCQDMARQRFEHIGEAIDEMVCRLEAVRAHDPAGGEDDDCRLYLSDAGRVQLGQLSAIFTQLEAAAHAVTEGFGETQAAGRLLAHEAVRCGGAALDGQIASRSIESVRQVLAVIQHAIDDIGHVIELVGSLRSELGNCSSQLLPITHRLQFAALNARISAEQLHAGKTVEVLAEMTNNIAKEAMLQFDELSLGVGSLVDSTLNLGQRLSDYRELAALEQNVLAKEAGESGEKLRALEDSVRRALAAIGPLEQELSSAIQGAIQQVRFPVTVATASKRSKAVFEEIVREYTDPEKELEARQDEVQALKRNYTMSHERVIHELALNIVAPPEMGSGEVARTSTDVLGSGRGSLVQETAQQKATMEPDEGEERLAANIELF